MQITQVKQQKNDKSRYSVFIDGEFAFGLSAEDIAFFGMKEGSEISQEKYDYIKNTLLYIKAQDTALKYLGRKMRTEREIIKKLEDYEEDIIERVLEFLRKYNYVNDLEYSCAYIRQCGRLNPKGSFAIRCKLRQMGVDNKTIDDALEKEEPDEIGAAAGLIEKKLCGERTVSFKEKRRLQEFLLRRGYSYDIIKEVFLSMEIKTEDRY